MLQLRAKGIRTVTRGPRFKVTLTHSEHFSTTPSSVAGVARGWRRRSCRCICSLTRVYQKGQPGVTSRSSSAMIKGDQPKNIRDRAIIMLFAVYGMRVGEVRGLKLEDLDWENEVIYLTRPKPRRRQSYPLSYTVGEAILPYLKGARPRISRREVFLTVKAPFQPLSSGSLYDLVSDRLRLLGVSLPHYGPHSLRHAC